MVKEEKRGKPSQKIMPFPTATEEKLEGLEDAAMDQFLRESVKKEADEIEKALNEDPKLIGVGASDDLFEKIVAELKKRGEWEEEEAGEAGLEGDRGEDKQEKRQKEQENRQEKGQQEQEEGQEEQEDQKEQKEGREKQEGQKEQEEGRKEQKSQKEKKEQEKQENKQEAKQPEGRGSEEEIYKLLSEEDRDALEYGRRMKKEKEIREQRKKHRRKRWQRAGVTAAALVLVMGVGMRSEANRRFALHVWEAVTNNFGIRMPINFVEQEELHIESDEEQEAFAEIDKKLNVAPVYFGYMPEEMTYEHYVINEEGSYAIVSYSYQDVFLDIFLKSGERENTVYGQVDGEKEEMELIVNEQNIEMKVYKIVTDEQEYSTATFVSGECYYCLSGMIPFEEMKKILKFLVISEK